MWPVATLYVTVSMRIWESCKIGWKKLNWKNIKDKLNIDTAVPQQNMNSDMTSLFTCSIIKKFQRNRIFILWLNSGSYRSVENGIKPLSYVCINHHGMGKRRAVCFYKGFHSSRRLGWAGGTRGHCHFQGLERMVGIVQRVSPEPRLQNKGLLFGQVWR